MKKLYYYTKSVTFCRELKNNERMREHIDDNFDFNDIKFNNFFTTDGNLFCSTDIHRIELSDSNSLYVHKKKFRFAFNEYLNQVVKETLNKTIPNYFLEKTLDDIIYEFYLRPSGISSNEFYLSIANIKSNEKFKDKIKDYKNYLEVLDIYFECDISKSIKLFEYLKNQYYH